MGSQWIKIMWKKKWRTVPNVDYHKNMESDIFEEWFEFTLISNLKPNSIIVLDNLIIQNNQRKFRMPTQGNWKSRLF
jgi:hypothetical protein